MRELKNGTKIIGVDTGYGNIKTANTVTPTGLIEYDTPPIFSGNILEYNGKYYRFGEGHKDFIADKTADEDFYILTLAAIARELKRSRICSGDVYLAEGLPLTWVRVQRDKFRAYLMRNKSVDFKFTDKDFHINFVGCSIYPQGYPAVIERIDELKGANMLADIGSGTINILYINNKKPIESKSWTEKLGVNQCAVRIENALMDNFGIKIDRSITDSFLKHGTADICAEYLERMNKIAAEYTTEIFETLYKYEYDPSLMRLWITGGGGRLIKYFGKYSVDRVTIIDDICAAAKGLEYIADPTVFVDKLSDELGRHAEYVQPDYVLEVSDFEDGKIEPDESVEEDTSDENQDTDINESEIIQSDNTDESVSETVPFEDKPETVIPDEILDATAEPIGDENEANEFVEEIEVTTSPLPTLLPGIDTLNNLQDDIQAAWQITKGAGARIAVIDDKIDATHPDFSSQIVNAYDVVNDTELTYNPEISSEYMHGTHVTGIIASTVPEAEIIPIAAFNGGQAYTSDIIKAIEYAREQGAEIVNCSFGSTNDNPALKEAMENSNMLFVCAAGNNRVSVDETPIYPASFDIDNVISVTSLNQDMGFSYYSNYGENVDIAMYGRNVYNTLPDGDYGEQSGTSMAAAYVTAAAGMAKSIGEENIKESILSTAWSLSNLQGKVCAGKKLCYSNLVYRISNTDVVEIYPEDDFDVNQEVRTPTEDWELFHSIETVDVEAGGSNTAFIKSDGTLWMAGSNTYGQLGVSTYSLKYSATPIQVVGVSDVVQVAVGDTHCIALDSRGNAYVWGSNTYHEVSSSTGTAIYTPVIHPISNIEYVEAGTNTTFVIQKRKGIYANGANNYGQLGVGTRNTTSTPTLVQGSQYASIVKSYGEHMLFIKDGVLWGSGSNNHYILGSTALGTQIYPVEITEAANVDTGRNHVITIDSSGTVHSWGANDYGQCGTGENGNILLGVKNAIDVKCGYDFTMVLLRDGTVMTWGYNNDGQIGDNSDKRCYTPYKVPISTPIYDIAAGSIHSIALDDENVLWYWGGNAYGQYGNGKTIASFKPTTEKNGSITSRKIAIGEDHILYIDENGKIYAKGKNTYGQLGLGNTTMQEDFKEVIGPWGDKKIVKVETRYNTSYAITEDRVLYAWGQDDSRQVGDVEHKNALSPVQIATDVNDVLAGKEHAVAIKTNGDVYGWGDSTYGQLGKSSGYYDTPVKIYSTARKIGVGDYQTFVIDTSSNLHGVGKNDKGQLGLSGTYNHTYFGATIMRPVLDVASGANHTVIRDTSQYVHTCGDNSDGQLGVTLANGVTYTEEIQATGLRADSVYAAGNTSIYLRSGVAYQTGKQYYKNTKTFTKLADAQNIRQLALNDKYTIAVDSSNHAWRWGKMSTDISRYTYENGIISPVNKIHYPYAILSMDAFRNQSLAINELNQVVAWGEGYYADGSDQMKINRYPTVINGISNPIQVSRGKNHNLVLDADGNVWGWGSNTNYPMGSNLGGKVKTATKLSGISNVQQIAGGTEFSIFLKKDGTLWGVGVNSSGQLGQGNYTRAGTPVQITTKNNFKKVTVGENYVVALASDGIYSWGGNSLGQLGTGTKTGRTTPQKITLDLAADETVVDIKATINYCMALTDKGNLYTWGDNGSGQLGIGGVEQVLGPVKVTRASNVTAIGGGKLHALIVNKNNYVYSWGYRDERLGYYSAKNVSAPSGVGALSGKKITKVAGGFDYSLALSKDGTLYTFGLNQYGQLGDNSDKAIEVWSPLINDLKWIREYMNGISQPVTSNVSLPASAPNGSKISWTSGNTYYMANDGSLVSRPDAYGTDTSVRFTATVTNGNESVKSIYDIEIAQDPSVKPSTDIPIRSIGMEYDQIYPDSAPDVYPEINAVSMSVIDEANGVYELTIRDDQYSCSSSGNPFFFWSARQGTFLPVEGYNDYRSVRFTVDPDALGKSVKVVVGIGDRLGYIDRKAVILDSVGEASAANEEVEAMPIENDYANNIAIGIDTSVNMLNFDPGNTKSHLSSIEGLIESAGDNSNIVLVSKDNIGYTKDTESAKNSLALMTESDYAGETDALSLLERCDEALCDAENIPQSGNKTAVIFVQYIKDKDSLKAKINELENKGISVYIMLLSSENSNIEQVKTSDSPLKLRLNVTELYDIFTNESEIMTMANNVDVAVDYITYLSDFRVGKHEMNVNDKNNITGAYIASILGMYSCLPAFTDEYNLFEPTPNATPLADDINNIAIGYLTNVSASSANTISSFYSDLISMDNKSAYVKNDDVDYVIRRNLKFRFPVIAKNNSDVCLITQVDNGVYKGYINNNFSDLSNISGVSAVFDTYQYLLATSESKTVTVINDFSDGSEKFYENIYYTCPDDYLSKDYTDDLEVDEDDVNDNTRAILYDSSKGYPQKNITIQTKNVKSENDKVVQKPFYKISDLNADDIILCGIKTTYENCLPNTLYTTRMYNVKKYDDLQVVNTNAEPWYYPSLIKATNIGMVGGDTDSYTGIPNENGSKIFFNPERNVTYGEFLKMLIESADIPDKDIQTSVTNQENNPEMTDGIIGHWAKKYLCYAIDKNIISIFNIKGNNSPDSNVLRCDAAYMINRLYIDDTNKLDVQIPSNLYKYNTSISCDRNTLWNSGKAFVDQSSIRYCKDEIQQLYLNQVLEGDQFGCVNSEENITRAEAVKMLIKCRYVLDEGLENAKLSTEGKDSNFIDFLRNSKLRIDNTNDENHSGEFYFVAPKTGYYYINNMTNCSVTISDMHKREITGLDAYNSSDQKTYGARYNILKGEVAYIKVNKTSKDYSFDISVPNDDELVFAPDRSGTFIYDNHPEYILQEDLADDRIADGFGNSTLTSNNNLSGMVDIVTSHLIRQGTLNPDMFNTKSVLDNDKINTERVYYDCRITNTGTQDLTVIVEGVGIQAAGQYGPVSDLTHFSSAGLQAWADLKQIDLLNSENYVANYNNLFHNYMHNNSEYEHNKPFSGNLADTLNSEKHLIKIPKGESRWVFTNDYRPKLPIYRDYGYSFCSLMRLNIIGEAKIETMMFLNQDAINSHPLNGKIYTSKSERDYSKDAVNKYDGSPGEKNEIGTKYKGVASSLAKVSNSVSWNILKTDSYYKPTVFNLIKPNGIQISKTNGKFNLNPISNTVLERDQVNAIEGDVWMTHINPANDSYNSIRGADSDMLGFIYDDGIKTWLFDTHHEDAEHGNKIITTQSINDGGKNYLDSAGSMGNFSIIEEYNLTLNNYTDSTQRVSYRVGTDSALYFRYKVGQNDYINSIKCETTASTKIYDYERDENGNIILNENQEPIIKKDMNGEDIVLEYFTNIYDIFNVTVPAQNNGQPGKIDVHFEVVVPNVGHGGFYNMLYTENLQ